jgi:thioredoxin 1
MSNSNIIQLSKSQFEETVINSPVPVLVDFWAQWCNPCKALAPVIDELATTYSDKIKVCKVNVDEENELAEQFSVMSIPTVLFFKNGEVVNPMVGAMPKSLYVRAIETLIQ